MQVFSINKTESLPVSTECFVQIYLLEIDKITKLDNVKMLTPIDMFMFGPMTSQ